MKERKIQKKTSVSTGTIKRTYPTLWTLPRKNMTLTAIWEEYLPYMHEYEKMHKGDNIRQKFDVFIREIGELEIEVEYKKDLTDPKNKTKSVSIQSGRKLTAQELEEKKKLLEKKVLQFETWWIPTANKLGKIKLTKEDLLKYITNV